MTRDEPGRRRAGLRCACRTCRPDRPAARLHGVGGEGVPARDIAGVIGRKLGLPVEPVPKEHFGWLGAFFALDTPASSALTQARFGWRPEQAGLLADLDHGTYFARA